MRVSIFEVTVMQKLSLLVIILCILISFQNQNADTEKYFNLITSSSSSSTSPSPVLSASRAAFLSMEDENLDQSFRGLEYDFYRDSCPEAEETIRAVVRYLYKVRSDVAPALLRLAFHDCFIEGCDASILLDAAEGIDSEKDSPPNEDLKGFDIIDIIKEELEEICPAVVSCADTLVLAAREGVVLAGGPFYPLYTGRRDSLIAFSDVATFELPSPHGDLSETLASFGSRGFDLRETVSLLGSHSIGEIHCKFFQNRLYNFGRTNKPDPSVDPDFLNLLRSRCRNTSSASSAPSPSFVGSPSTSAAPSPHLDGSPSSVQAQSPHLDGPPSSQQAQPPVLGGSPLSSAAPSTHLDGSPPSSMQTQAPHLDGPPSSQQAQPPVFGGSPLSSAAPSPHLDGSPSSMQTQSPHLDGSPSLQQAQPPVFGSSPLSSASQSPELDGSPLPPAASSSHMDDTPVPSVVPSSHLDSSPLWSAVSSPHLDGSPLSSAASFFSLRESSSSSREGPGIDMAQDGTTAGFGTAYYRNLLQGKGILYSDQQLMAGEETRIWVTAYASDVSLFRKNFALAMMKLSNLRVLTVPMGQIRLSCSKVA
ncbi:putative Peroxidase 48 [Pistacia vera]|uniref:putative Peroxidase 48 n=1 Tax=Pistacia vera TaxID=55513 RepID=UPI00126389D6|nr:putative Peroxidase 48 [Pistacia vera]